MISATINKDFLYSLMANLEHLPRSKLQKLAKKNGIKANQKVSHLNYLPNLKSATLLCEIMNLKCC